MNPRIETAAELTVLAQHMHAQGDIDAVETIRSAVDALISETRFTVDDLVGLATYMNSGTAHLALDMWADDDPSSFEETMADAAKKRGMQTHDFLAALFCCDWCAALPLSYRALKTLPNQWGIGVVIEISTAGNAYNLLTMLDFASQTTPR